MVGRSRPANSRRRHAGATASIWTFGADVEIGVNLTPIPTSAAFLHGELDVLGQAEIARSWASRLAKEKIVVFEGQQHDILNESVHADVAKEIIAFVESYQ